MSKREEAGVSDALPFKLRYASHLGIVSLEKPLFAATLGTLDPVVHIDYAADQGFAGIEDNFLLRRPVEDQARIGEALARRGMEMGCFVGSFDPASRIWVSADEASRAAIDVQIEGARRVGGRYIVVAPARDAALPLARQLAVMVDHLRRIAPRAERAGVIICLEQTNEYRLPGMLLHHIADAYAVARAVASPAVKLLFDFFHVQLMDGNLVANFDRCRDEVAIVQIADLPSRCEPGGGEVHWANVLRGLRDRGYTGLVEYEIFPSGVGMAGEQAALDALRRVDAAI